MNAFISLRRFAQAFLVAILCCALPALAQFTSRVQGTVTDPSGAVVSGATVNLTDTATNISYNTTTSSSGVYHFVSLPPGNYVVTVIQAGFKQAKISTTVTTEATVGVDVQLQVATTGQNVTVTGQTTGLNPEETRLQLTISASQLELIPSQNHATLNIMKLAPGVTGIIEGASDIPIGQNGPALSANGLSAGSNLYTLDGVPLASVADGTIPGSTNRSGGILFTPNLDALTEVAMQTATFNVEYGGQSSMQVGMTTKAGSNKFHGVADVTYFNRNMRAAAYNQTNLTAYHEIFDSFALGGPIWKDHTFFFGSYEHAGQYGAGSGSEAWWTPQFAQYIATADPNSVDVQNLIVKNPATRLVLNGVGIQTGADIFGTPAAPIEGNGCGTPSVYNIPCTMNVVEQGIVNAPSILDGRNWNVRGDQYFNNSKDRIFFFYFSNLQSSNAISALPTWDAESPTGGQDYTTNYTHTFSPSLLNTATFAYTAYHYAFAPAPTGTNALLAPYDTIIQDNGNVRAVTFFVPSYNTEKQTYGRDAVYWTHGRHSFEFGFEAANNPETTTSGIYARPFDYYFPTTLNFLSDQLHEEVVYSHFSGLTGQFQPSTQNGVTTRFAGYVQDSWKVAPRLTVNYGIRWDDLGNPSEYTGTVPWANSIFSDSNINNIATTIASKQVTSAFNGSKDKNFLPRVGFAWTPFADQSDTVLRGGVGLYQDTVNLANLAVDLTSNPPVGTLGFTLTAPGTPTSPPPLLSWGTDPSKPPYGFQFQPVAVPVYRPDGSIVGSTANITGVDPNMPISRTLLWNIAIERQFAGHAVMSIGYSGSHSYNLQYQPDLNRPQGNYYCNTPGPGCAKTNHVLNSEWNTITPFLAGLTSNYNALIAQVRQNWRSLTWNASYTWGHSLDMPNSWDSPIELQYDPQAEYSSTNYDITNRISAFYLYQIPVPASANGLVRAFAGGWNLDGTVVAQGGQPFTPYYSNMDFSGTGATSPYAIPNYTGTQHGGWTKAQWKSGIFPTALSSGINPLFPAPTCLCIGNAGRNQFRGPGYASWDQSIVKKITMPWFQGESSVLSLRGQAFNLLNRVNFSSLTNVTPNSGAAFGTITGANQGRVIQIGARLEF